MKKFLVALGWFVVIAALAGAQVRPAADSTLGDARRAIDTGRYADAEKLLAVPAASAPGGDAALELGKLQLYLGKKTEGTRTLDRMINASAQNTAADFVRLGEAERALGQFQQANADFRQANQLAPQNVAANIGWGELFAEKYNRSDAAKSFQAALMVEPDNVRAKVGMAGLMTDANPPAARQLLGEVLNKDPNYVPAHVLMAQIALDDGKRDEAKESLRKALASNPNSTATEAEE